MSFIYSKNTLLTVFTEGYNYTSDLVNNFFVVFPKLAFLKQFRSWFGNSRNLKRLPLRNIPGNI